MKPRYLSKSRFKLAMECPTKLYYTGKKEYVNRSLTDPFLEALAEGGFQIGELAKLYHPKGIDIESLDYTQALYETNELMNKQECIIYEAAIQHENFFIRADILIKQGNRIDLIEVKSKSVDEYTDSFFIGKRGGLLSSWAPYVYDIAFQKHVTKLAYPEYEVRSFLMLVDKNALCPTDNLNQKFKIVKEDSGRKYAVLTEQLTKEDLSTELLVKINTDTVCDLVYSMQFDYLNKKLNFADLLQRFADKYAKDEIIGPKVNKECKRCEFHAEQSDIDKGLKSGYHECFMKDLGWGHEDFLEDTIFDMWNFRQTEEYIKNRKIKLSDLNEENINPKTDGKAGLSASMRQWVQLEKSLNKDKSPWIDIEGLRAEMESWRYPLHFIDFETAMPAIPFNKGKKPYEGIAFQFSHHKVYEDGRIEHAGQYLNANPGEFPNYEFLRELKRELEQDEGSIFRYAAHENTYLRFIYNQMRNDNGSMQDAKELCSFIQDITQFQVRGKNIYGKRNMIDMLELVKRYYYHPNMKGSNSIKAVLPALLNSSQYLIDKYSRPVYGSKEGIKSLNYVDWTWVVIENERIKDPYKLLPGIFVDMPDIDYDLSGFDDELADGGAAMSAYSRLQYEKIPQEVRSSIEKALLKYCELDTLAMVMIYEAWKHY